MQYITVTVDTNDADYDVREEQITNEQLEKIMPVIEAIRNFKPYEGTWESYSGPDKAPYPMTSHHDSNWPDGECLREDMGEKPVKEIYSQLDPKLIDYFQEMFLPYPEYGFHTIVSIDIREIIFIKSLLG